MCCLDGGVRFVCRTARCWAPSYVSVAVWVDSTDSRPSGSVCVDSWLLVSGLVWLRLVMNVTWLDLCCTVCVGVVFAGWLLLRFCFFLWLFVRFCVVVNCRFYDWGFVLFFFLLCVVQVLFIVACLDLGFVEDAENSVALDWNEKNVLCFCSWVWCRWGCFGLNLRLWIKTISGLGQTWIWTKIKLKKKMKIKTNNKKDETL